MKGQIIPDLTTVQKKKKNNNNNDKKVFKLWCKTPN